MFQPPVEQGRTWDSFGEVRGMYMYNFYLSIYNIHIYIYISINIYFYIWKFFFFDVKKSSPFSGSCIVLFPAEIFYFFSETAGRVPQL